MANFQLSTETMAELIKYHDILQPFVIRRIKKDVLKELPDKNLIERFVEMDYMQSKTYSLFEEILDKIENKELIKDKIFN